jgi:hypothetical protein
LPCWKNKLDDSSRLDAVEITRVPDMLPRFFSFLVGLRTYQHAGVQAFRREMKSVIPCKRAVRFFARCCTLPIVLSKVAKYLNDPC